MNSIGHPGFPAGREGSGCQEGGSVQKIKNPALRQGTFSAGSGLGIFRPPRIPPFSVPANVYHHGIFPGRPCKVIRPALTSSRPCPKKQNPRQPFHSTASGFPGGAVPSDRPVFLCNRAGFWANLSLFWPDRGRSLLDRSGLPVHTKTPEALIFKASPHLEHHAFQVVRFRRGQKHGVVPGLTAQFHQSQLPAHIPGGVQ